MNVIPQRVKDGFVALIGPLARALIRAGVHPNTITTVGTLLVVGSGVAFAAGAIRLGGLLLLIGRYVPLGLTLLGPVIVNILLFHIFLEPSGLPMAIVVAVLALFLLCRYRTNFAGLVKP